MARKRNDPESKPPEEWGVKEWERAYGVLMRRYEMLRSHMRLAIQQLNKSI